ncbi:MAG TPA: hypothetical protein VGL71_12565 [Urbifossiella sp.]
MSEQTAIVVISFPGAFILGGWHKYDVYLNHELLGTGSYSRGFEHGVLLAEGEHELLVRPNHLINRKSLNRTFALDLKDSGLYLVRVKFDQWSLLGGWKPPEIIKLYPRCPVVN